MLKYRLLTALIGVPLVLYLVLAAPFPSFQIFISLFAGLSAWESYKLVARGFEKFDNEFQMRSLTRTALAVLVFIFVLLMTIHSVHGSLMLPLFCLVLLIAVLWVLILERGINARMFAFLSFLFTFFYAAIPWTAIGMVKNLFSDGSGVLFLLAVVWLGDTGAYFGGLTFGRKIFPNFKFSPTLSSAKTLEGSLSGIFMSVIAGLVVWSLFPHLAPTVLCVITLAVVLSILGQAGDLFESAMKRFAGVKDSGQIVPGHGGFLDRVDGVVIAAPFLYLWFWVFGT